jgi:proline racemase
MFSPYQATIVAFSQSSVGDTLVHVSVIGTSFQRIACNE